MPALLLPSRFDVEATNMHIRQRRVVWNESADNVEL